MKVSPISNSDYKPSFRLKVDENVVATSLKDVNSMHVLNSFYSTLKRVTKYGDDNTVVNIGQTTNGKGVFIFSNSMMPNVEIGMSPAGLDSYVETTRDEHGKLQPPPIINVSLANMQFLNLLSTSIVRTGEKTLFAEYVKQNGNNPEKVYFELEDKIHSEKTRKLFEEQVDIMKDPKKNLLTREDAEKLLDAKTYLLINYAPEFYFNQG